MEQRIILETDRLFLREMNIDDFDALYKVLADRHQISEEYYRLNMKAWRNY